MNDIPASILDIEVYDVYGDGHWAQAKYLVHGFDDVLWTDDLEAAMCFMKHQIYEYKEDKLS